MATAATNALTKETDYDAEADLVVIGAGVAGMTTALIAAVRGLSVILCEKTAMVGGNSSTSGGTTWAPGTALSLDAGVPDRTEDAAQFLRHIVGNRGGEVLRAAFLESAPQAIAEIVATSHVRFTVPPAHPDYHDGPGSAHGGRALAPVEFDGRRLGRDFARIRPPRDVFMGLGGMMVARGEIAALLSPFASLGNLKTTLRTVLRYGRDRLRYRRGTRLLMGNAMVGQLFLSLRERNVPIWFDSPLQEIITTDGRATGAVIATPCGPRRIRARKGVVMASGGIGWNRELRARFFPPEVAPTSQLPASISGDGIMAGQAAGGALDDGGDSAGLWMPCSVLRRGDGTASVWPHILLDRAKPGLIAVGADGRRFVNESDSYHDFCMGMIRAGLHEAWLIVDRPFIRNYGLGLVLPGGRGLGRLLRQGYVVRGATLAALARATGVDAAGLAESVAANNRYAKSGTDADFGRGASAMNRFNGDAAHQPNPCIGPISTGPFYAVRVVIMDLAGAGGLACDANGMVLDSDGRPIPGLYACGNDAATIFRGTYPGPGTTLGPAMVFGWRIASHAAGTL
ncbi:MAG: FAD-dependent oxidoreductase [Paracoccus sp. (in: a-proteobacteria)]|nr:FAD-dependent oxidoreductase [Paracoccus sp. (in: a-proteobacteria)]